MNGVEVAAVLAGHPCCPNGHLMRYVEQCEEEYGNWLIRTGCSLWCGGEDDDECNPYWMPARPPTPHIELIPFRQAVNGEKCDCAWCVQVDVVRTI